MIVIYNAGNAAELAKEISEKGLPTKRSNLSEEIRRASGAMEETCMDCPSEGRYLLPQDGGLHLFVCRQKNFRDVPACAGSREQARVIREIGT